MIRQRRALLFMPGDDLRKIEKGAGLDVDAIIMDLEDGVAPAQKPQARETIFRALDMLAFGSKEKLIRINPIGSGLAHADFEATIAARPDGYVIPKVESASQLRAFAGWLEVAERQLNDTAHAISILALVESAQGIVRIAEIAQATRRLSALVFGAEDFASSIGAQRTANGDEVAYARGALITHAKAFGLQAIDTPYVALNDPEGLQNEAHRAAAWGFDGKLAIHPAQVPMITQAFTPAEAQIEQARALLAAFEAHQQSGVGVFRWQDQMVDMPMIRAAQHILARAGLL
ncbi:MAG: HpcH/HpaI aldolase/citrate lyase family protein [Anaerolineales bacterium]